MVGVSFEQIGNLVIDLHNTIEQRPVDFPGYSGLGPWIYRKSGLLSKGLSIKNEDNIQASLETVVEATPEDIAFIVKQGLIKPYTTMEVLAAFKATPDDVLSKYKNFFRKHQINPQHLFMHWPSIRRLVMTDQDNYLALKEGVENYFIFNEGTFIMYDTERVGTSIINSNFHLLTNDDYRKRSDAIALVQNQVGMSLVEFFNNNLTSVVLGDVSFSDGDYDVYFDRLDVKSSFGPTTVIENSELKQHFGGRIFHKDVKGSYTLHFERIKTVSR